MTMNGVMPSQCLFYHVGLKKSVKVHRYRGKQETGTQFYLCVPVYVFTCLPACGAFMNKKTVKDIDLKGKRVLMRVDFNVPMQDGKVTDDKRIKASLPTIKYVLDQGASLILMSHLGRPKGGPDPEFSLRAAAEVLSSHLGIPVKMAPDTVGSEVEKMAKELKPDRKSTRL